MSTLSMMTWNVRYFGHGLGGLRATEAWIRLAARTIARLDATPDVLALQEVETLSLRAGLGEKPQLDRFLAHLHTALAERGDATRYHGIHFPAHAYGVRGVNLYTTGLAVLVKESVTIEDHNACDPHDITHVRLRSFRPLKQRRIAAHVRLRPDGARDAVDLFNTHLSLPAFLEVGPHRVPARMGHGSNQLAEAFKVLELLDLRGSDRSVVMGDFNAAPRSPVYQAFTARGLVDAHRHHDDAHDAHASARFLNQRMHIDHVFASPGLRWRRFRAHRIDDQGPFHGLSDHAPKVGVLEL